jgi:hypothetical protein
MIPGIKDERKKENESEKEARKGGPNRKSDVKENQTNQRRVRGFT